MAKSLMQTIQEGMATSTPGNIGLPSEIKDPGKGGNDPKAQGKPAPPDKLLTDPEVKNKEVRAVTKKLKKSKNPAPNNTAKETFAKQGSSVVKVKEEEEVEDDDLILDEEEVDETDDDLAEFDEDDFEISDEIIEHIAEMDDEDIAVQYAELLALVSQDLDEEADEDDDEDNIRIDEESGETIQEIRRRITASDIDMTEDVAALFSSDDEETELSEDFQAKAEVIFEAAVVSRVNAKLDEMEELFKNELVEAIESHEAELGETVNNYLNYVVEDWMTTNELAVERGIRSEIAEGFLQGLHGLFAEHYVEVPEEKVDVMEALAAENDALTVRLNEQIEANIDLSAGHAAATASEIILEETRGLADTQVEKIRDLVENVEFEDEDQFRSAVSTLRESYLPETVEYVDDDDDVDEDLSEHLTEDADGVTGAMGQYTQVLSRQFRAGRAQS